jgi:hypothetical protein
VYLLERRIVFGKEFIEDVEQSLTSSLFVESVSRSDELIEEFAQNGEAILTDEPPESDALETSGDAGRSSGTGEERAQ